MVVSRFDAPPGCAAEAVVVDRAQLDRFGAHALYLEGASLRVVTAYPAHRRPFMPPVPE